MSYGVNSPFGLVPLGSLAGGAWSEKTNKYYITCANDGTRTLATPILQGDLVIYNVTAAGAPIHGTIQAYNPTNADATDAQNATPVIGVFVKCEYYDTNSNFICTNKWPGGVNVKAGTVITAYVIDDIDVLYSAQIAGYAGANPANAQYALLPVGSNAGIGLEGLADNPTVASRLTTGVSAMFLANSYTANAAQSATLATMPLKIQGIVQSPGSYTAGGQTYALPPTNNFTGFNAPYLNFVVSLNHTVKRAGTAGNAIV